MSPEQASGDPDIDQRTDVYSLGCVLYEMLTGRPPFAGKTIDQVLHLHLTEDPPAVTSTRERVTSALSDAVAKAMAKVPADRFTTTSQFAEAVRGSTTQSRRSRHAHRHTRRCRRTVTCCRRLGRPWPG